MPDLRQRFLFGGPVDESFGTGGALALLRVYTGLALALAHGLGKLPPGEGFVEGVAAMGFPLPLIFAWLSGIAEFFGGILLALGLLTRPAALVVAINMFVAVVFSHVLLRGDPFSGYELALFFLLAAVVFLVRGSGPFSLDGRIQRMLDRRI